MTASVLVINGTNVTVDSSANTSVVHTTTLPSFSRCVELITSSTTTTTSTATSTTTDNRVRVFLDPFSTTTSTTTVALFFLETGYRLDADGRVINESHPLHENYTTSTTPYPSLVAAQAAADAAAAKKRRRAADDTFMIFVFLLAFGCGALIGTGIIAIFLGVYFQSRPAAPEGDQKNQRFGTMMFADADEDGHGASVKNSQPLTEEQKMANQEKFKKKYEEALAQAKQAKSLQE